MCDRERELLQTWCTVKPAIITDGYTWVKFTNILILPHIYHITTYITYSITNIYVFGGLHCLSYCHYLAGGLHHFLPTNTSPAARSKFASSSLCAPAPAVGLLDPFFQRKLLNGDLERARSFLRSREADPNSLVLSRGAVEFSQCSKE
jgi:hypothetical protein